ncbi:hypothetical protein BX666DRAFT_2011039 [Dichotomocladium elegans]|nr:hypothetical protein BX666DRAFT_2011039 [Dichotomocladium elegans]
MKAHHQEQQQQQQQQQQQKSQSTSSPPVPQEMATVNGIEDDLHHLQDEWASIEIVLKSLQNAYSVRPLENAPEQLLDDVDRELSIAYDELKAQVRHLARSLQRLDKKIEPFRPLKPSLAQSPDQHYQPHSGGTYCPSMLARPRD